MGEKMMSLYDYLGKAAGLKLGKEVNRVARIGKEKIKLRDIANPGYVGKVILYRESFLKRYFSES